MNEAEDGREQPAMRVRLEAAKGRQRPRTEEGAGAASPETGEEPNGGDRRDGSRQTDEGIA